VLAYIILRGGSIIINIITNSFNWVEERRGLKTIN
jgi:hypothetical protein